MTSPDPSARPAQVTVAGWVVTIASVFLVLSTFEALGNLNSVETREQLAQAIDSGNLQGLGISVAEALDVKRWALYVSAVAASLTAILGFFALRRDTMARLVLSLGAVPIVVAVPLTGSFLAMMIGAGAAVMWSAPARDWFAGRPVTPRPPRAARTPASPAEPPAADPPTVPGPWVPPSSAPRPDGPAPTQGWGASPGSVTAEVPGQGPSAPQQDPAAPNPYAPNPYAPQSGAPYSAAPYPAAQYPTVQYPTAQYPANPYPYGAPPVPGGSVERPRQVRNACLITWIASGFAGVLYLLMLAAVIIDQQGVIDIVKENPAWDSSYDEDLIVTALIVGSVIFLIWCVAIAVVAVFTWRGARWAWIVHLISTGAAGGVALLGLPVSLLHLAAIGAAFGLLMSRHSRAWFTKTRR